MMLYHRNRLIKPYVKLGCQTKGQVSAFFWQPVSAFFCRLTWAIRTMCKSLPSSQDVSGLLDHGTSVCLFCGPSSFRQHFLSAFSAFFRNPFCAFCMDVVGRAVSQDYKSVSATIGVSVSL